MINKFAVSILLVSGLCATANAEQAYLAPLVKESMLLDVAHADKTIVVGERGHILVGDSEQLSQVNVPSTVTLTAVDGIGNTYLAVGHDATILRSSDAGASWEEVFSAVELDRPFLDVIFLDQNEAIAIGGYGLFYRSTDAGLSWTQEQQVSLLSDDDNEYLESIADDPEFLAEELNYIFPHFNRLSKAGDTLYLVGEAGLVAKSSDRGRSWERFDIDYAGSFFDVQRLSTGAELAVGLRGNMFIQNDDQQWLSLTTCVTTSLNSIVNTDVGLFVVGNNGVVLALEPEVLLSEQYQSPNSEGCARHAGLTQVDSDISSSISNAFLSGNVLTAVSANGLQPVE
ncbi:sialidase [Glaciecola siphonariae]|uniref:Sialidase n=1 Tax=Glaciecola siphonariae TaxID=521012 RepID=A0ABV9LTI0_9ALTE